ncbi:MAG: potassium-transporting ATPase subunit F [Rhodanobacteraceae bacterium]|nr:potassium-transporting ATPase subunit F [Rhodanobacteraceae bacterium]
MPGALCGVATMNLLILLLAVAFAAYLLAAVWWPERF